MWEAIFKRFESSQKAHQQLLSPNIAVVLPPTGGLTPKLIFV